MNIKAYTIIVFLFFSYLGLAQNTILCPIQEAIITIEDPVNIPSITNNPDGTITLTHSEAYITDIFANYVIHDLRLTYPTGTGGLLKYYTIAFETKDLINDLNTNVPSSIFITDSYESTPISNDIINFLDGQVFDLIKYCSDVPEVGEVCANNEQNVPNDFYLGIQFNYDVTNDLMQATIVGQTPCENSFSISLKGGVINNRLQLWISNPGTTTETSYEDPCHQIENMLYGVLGISCFEESHYGDTGIDIVVMNDTFLLHRETTTFSTDILTFRDHRLSINDNHFETIKLISNYNSTYINFSNIDNENYSIEIYNISGKQILKNTPFNNNSISIESFATGMYFIKLHNDKTSKVFKLVKN